MEDMKALLRDFADILRYPAQGKSHLLAVLDRLCSGLEVEAARGHLGRLREAVAPISDDALEELYTRTFDINPAVTLDVGYHLFGLAYKRGDFLVRMQQALREHEIDQHGELADHLPLLLELAATLPWLESRSLIEECLVLPVSRMSEGFDVGETADAGYGLALAALHAWISTHFEAVRLAVASASLNDNCVSDFASQGESHE